MSYKICPNCGYRNKVNSSNCAYCGYYITYMQMPMYQQPQAQVPVKQKKKSEGLSTLLIVILLFFFALSNKDDDDDNYSTNTTTEITTEITTETTTEISKSFLECLYENMDKPVADDLYSIFTSELGYSEDELLFDGKEDSPNMFSVYADNIHYYVTALTEEYRIWNSSFVLYENGEVKLTKQDVIDRTFDTGDGAAYYIMAQEIVEQCLTNPKSADFPSYNFSGEVAIMKNKDLVAVQSNVTSKNSFNAKITTSFCVQFYIIDIDTYSYSPTYVRVGDEASGTFIDME